ncbi:hypothetical protein DC498_14490 [Terrimonas sp.]|uniref:hypothetical protein n=1 Tax=Terrimonas sp. TaxID=1914338 RepID=UPI000D520892|nr:hypothetical protein [Terrimonas sp.]PVD51625.1 hypothetical protein DC498_14490 [Terrimonas sp.]
MKRNIQIDEFEKFLREKSDQYKLYPSDKIWNNINRSVHSGRKWPYIILTLFAFLGSAVFVDYKTFNYVIPGKQTQSSHISSNSGLNNTTLSNNVIVAQNTNQDNFSTLKNTREASTGNIKNNRSFSVEKQTTITAAQNEQSDIAGDDSYADYSDIQNNANKVKNTPVKGLLIVKNNKEEQEESRVKKVLWAGEAFKKSRLTWQISFSPTISYRRLTSGLSEITDVFRGVPYSNVEQNTPVNKLVNHKPAIGAEVGAGVTYKLANNFVLRGGLQLNYSRYQVSVFDSKPEATTLALQGSNGLTDSVTLITPYQNYAGAGASWLNNEYLQISMPIGFEWTVLGSNSPLKWNIGASAQPVYNFANNVYLLSTDFKHYVQDPSLIKKWNINAGVETFVSYDMGSFKWQVGPQFRYQLTSSYKKQYPIKEYMVDFGFKIGVTKTIR